MKAAQTEAVPLPAKPDIHVDLDGTLILPVKNENGRWGHGLNMGLAQVLTEKQEEGHRIVLHTGGDKVSKSDQVAELFSQQAPALSGAAAVRGKEGRRGEVVELAIDDDPPERLTHVYGLVIKQHIDVTDGGTRARTDAPYFREKISAAVDLLRPPTMTGPVTSVRLAQSQNTLS